MVQTTHFVLAFALVSTSALAQQGGFASFPERQKERQASRWTLGNWMNTKRQIEEQNSWLWAHTNKVPLEFALGYTQSPTRWRTDVDAFVARLGLRASYGKRVNWFKESGDTGRGPNDDLTQFAAQIRVFGGNLQDSYLMGRVGYELSGFDNAGALAGNFGSWYAEPELQIYLAKWLGVRGNVRYRWSGVNMSNKTQTWGGTNYETVAFLESGALRVEAGHRWVNWDIDGASPIKHTELLGALKIFF